MTLHRLYRPLRPARPLPVVTAALLATALAVSLSACGGGSGGSGSSSSSGAAARSAQDGAATVEQAAAPAAAKAAAGVADGVAVPGAQADGFSAATGSSSSAKTSAPLAADPGTPAKRVRTGEITVQVSDLRAAADRVRATADRLDGSVASEDIRSSLPGSPAGATMTLRVPEPKLDNAMNSAGATGKELSRSATSDDVTATLADLDSREASQQASVDRVRALMSQAKNLRDIVLLESELSRRETDLEAAQASQRALADQAAQATLTVSLTTTAPGATRPKPKDDGFMAGLRTSWHAVQRSTTVLLTVLGALLPVGVVLAILGWPAYLVVRRVRRTQHPRPEATVPAAPAP